MFRQKKNAFNQISLEVFLSWLLKEDRYSLDKKKEFLENAINQNRLEFLICSKDYTLEFFKEIISLINANMHHNGFSLLHCQIGVAQFKERVEILLAAGVNFNLCDMQFGGGTLLHMLLANESFEKFNWVLDLALKHQQKIIVCAQDKEGKTILLLATKVMNSDAVKHILTQDKNKASLHIADNEGRTPLHIACALGQVDIVTMLLEAGASIDIPDMNGKTPIDYANFTQEKVRELLWSIHIDPDRDSRAKLNAIYLREGIPFIVEISDTKNLAIQFTRNVPGSSIIKHSSFGCVLSNQKNRGAIFEIMQANPDRYTESEKIYIENQLSELSSKTVLDVCIEGQAEVKTLLPKPYYTIAQKKISRRVYESIKEAKYEHYSSKNLLSIFGHKLKTTASTKENLFSIKLN